MTNRTMQLALRAGIRFTIRLLLHDVTRHCRVLAYQRKQQQASR